MTTIDLSHPLDPTTPVYPDYPRVRFEVLDAVVWPAPPEGRRLNSSLAAVGLHAGTHMDAPFHFHADGKTIEQVELWRCSGPAVLVRLPHEAHPTIEVTDLQPRAEAIHRCRRVVLDTGWHGRWGKPGYFSEHPVLSGEVARWLVEAGVVLVGVDFPSVDRPPHAAHVPLLGGGVLIVENLTNLAAVGREEFTFTALPLPLSGRDGSPVRAVASW